MSTASFVPATVRFSRLCLICSRVGLSTNRPSTYPTIAAATGFDSGTSLSQSAAALAVIARGSHVLTPS